MLVMIDNYDSFTFNVVHYLEELGQHVHVVRNDEVGLSELEALVPTGLIISPGPCTPDEAGISLAAILHFSGKLPILGICLGHQAIGQAFGGDVVRSPALMHGKTSVLTHQQQGLFAKLPSCFSVARYHSLVLDPKTLPDVFHIDAWTQSADSSTPQIMAIRHKNLPIWGVQFHPEAILTEHGHDILSAFLQNIEKL